MLLAKAVTEAARSTHTHSLLSCRQLQRCHSFADQTDGNERHPLAIEWNLLHDGEDPEISWSSSPTVTEMLRGVSARRRQTTDALWRLDSEGLCYGSADATEAPAPHSTNLPEGGSHRAGGVARYAVQLRVFQV